MIEQIYLGIVAITMIAQMAVAIGAISLIGVSKRKSAWIILAIAMTLQAFRRIYHFSYSAATWSDIVPDTISLAVSLLMLVFVLKLRSYFLDIRSSQGLLLDTNSFLREILESSLSISIISTDQSGKIVYWNSGAEAIFGYSAGDAVGKPVAMLYKPGDAHTEDAVDEIRRWINEERTPVRRELLEVRKDGREVWVAVTASPRFNEEGTIIGTTGIGEDITAARDNLRFLRESEERYRQLVESSPDAVGVHSEGILRFVNAAAVKLFGASSARDMIGKNVMDFVHPDDRAEVIRRVRMEIEEQAAAPPMEERMLMLDGTVIEVEVVAAPVIFGGQPAGQVIARDIRERKRSEAKLRASLAEKEVLLKEVHHRVKNNLQIISSLLNLQVDALHEPKTRELFEESRNRVRSMAMIHEQLYRSDDFSNIEFSGYVRSLTQQLVRSLGTAQSRISLNLDVPTISLSMDRAIPCGMIINELVSNCMKHAFHGREQGSIMVSIGTEEGGLLTLTVADDGTGMAEQSRTVETASLGLKLVDILVEQLGGTLEVRRNAGTGTSFSIRCPLK